MRSKSVPGPWTPPGLTPTQFFTPDRFFEVPGPENGPRRPKTAKNLLEPVVGHLSPSDGSNAQRFKGVRVRASGALSPRTEIRSKWVPGPLPGSIRRSFSSWVDSRRPRGPKTAPRGRKQRKTKIVVFFGADSFSPGPPEAPGGRTQDPRTTPTEGPTDNQA